MDINPILYIGATGVVALITGWATHRLTTSANRESEERQAKRRVEEEQRQEIRESRRERVRPVMDFLEAAKRKFASQTIGSVFDDTVQKLPPELRMEKAAQLLELKERATGDDLDTYEFVRLLLVAVTSSQSIPGLNDKLLTIYAGQQSVIDPEVVRQWGPVVASAEEMIERYIVSADPSPIRPEGIVSDEALPAPTVEKT